MLACAANNSTFIWAFDSVNSSAIFSQFSTIAQELISNLDESGSPLFRSKRALELPQQKQPQFTYAYKIELEDKELWFDLARLFLAVVAQIMTSTRGKHFITKWFIVNVFFSAGNANSKDFALSGAQNQHQAGMAFMAHFYDLCWKVELFYCLFVYAGFFRS